MSSATITATTSPKKSLKPRDLINKGLAYLMLIIITFASLFPLLWMISSSLKERRDIFLNPPMWIPTNPQWNNFTYAFAKYTFKFQGILFGIVLASMMVPSETTIIPMFEIYRAFGLIDNPWGVIVANVASAFGIFFMRQYSSGIHTEMLEASRIDGCSEFRIFTSIVLPNLRPALASLGIITFVNQWNNFLWPLIVLRSPSEQTISLAIRTLESGARTPYELIMAGSVISIIPLLIIVLLFQKQLIGGLMDGAVKG
ncbi:carbohydrate ABC transporter permease [Paenibacillus sp. MCAF20]